MRRRAGLAVVAIGLPLLSGCAGSSSDLSLSAQRQLLPIVESMRTLIKDHDFTGLQSAVQRLDQLVERLERQGQVSTSRGTDIEDAADALLTSASPSPTPSPSPLPTTTSPSPSRTPTPTHSPSPTPSPTTPSATPTTATPSPSVTITFL